jgi:membrane-associated phospholipid phosphatase
MKRMSRALEAYWIVFLLFELSLGIYIALFGRFDQMRIVNDWHVYKLDYLFRLLSFAGELLIPVLVLILFFVKKRAWVKPFLISYASSTLIVQGLKHLIFPADLRPYAFFKSLDFNWYLVPGVDINEYFSFPSGHTAAAWFCFVWIALYVNKRWTGVLMAILACGVGISRVYLFQHFPMDVLAGAFIGISCSSIFYLLHHETIAE